jgi:hypothetical protein
MVDEETPDDVRRRMGAVALEDMEKFVPLQAADHLAFESYHYRNDPRGTLRPAIKSAYGLGSEPWELLRRTKHFEIH